MSRRIATSLTDDPAVGVPLRPSASVILVRNGLDGLQTFMIERDQGLAFAPGATVFPGGGVEQGDADPAWGGLVSGDHGDRTHRIAAIRELFEEAGLLLADPAGARPIGPGGFLDRIRDGGCRLTTTALVPFAHWQTPAGVRRRFDTLFYLCAAPDGQEPAPDGREAVAAAWAAPAALLAEEQAGGRRLVFATRMLLLRLTTFTTVAEALTAAKARPPVTVLPRRVETVAGPVFRVPEDAGYAPVDTPADRVRFG